MGTPEQDDKLEQELREKREQREADAAREAAERTFPRWRYHADGRRVVVATPAEEKELGAGWEDSPPVPKDATPDVNAPPQPRPGGGPDLGGPDPRGPHATPLPTDSRPVGDPVKGEKGDPKGDAAKGKK